MPMSTDRYAHAGICTYMHACMHMSTHGYMKTYLRTYIHIYMHTHIHSCTPACSHFHVSVCMYIPTYIGIRRCMMMYAGCLYILQIIQTHDDKCELFAIMCPQPLELSLTEYVPNMLVMRAYSLIVSCTRGGVFGCVLLQNDPFPRITR